jgi:hypothetical protein
MTLLGWYVRFTTKALANPLPNRSAVYRPAPLDVSNADRTNDRRLAPHLVRANGDVNGS